MAGLLIVPGIWPVIDANGTPVSGATINFYEPGTTTPKAVYSSSTLSTSLGTQLTTNAGGEPTTLAGTVARLWWAADGAAFDVQVTAGGSNRTWQNVSVNPTIGNSFPNLLLSKFVTSPSGDATAGVQAAFDAAAATGQPLVGDWRAGGYEIAGKVIVKSNTTYFGDGAQYIKTSGGGGLTELQKIANWSSVVFESQNWLTGYIDNVVMNDLNIRDLDNNRDGMFVRMKVNGLRMARQKFKKLSPNWTQLYAGSDHIFTDPDVDCYDATSGAATPTGYQVWCDGMHFNEVSDVQIINPNIRADDDCIAFTIDTATWDGMQPSPGKINKNISITGGRLQTRLAHWITLGCDPVGNATVLPVGSAYQNVLISNVVYVAKEDSVASEGCGFNLYDHRPAATARHDNIVFDGGVIEAQGSAYELFQVFGTNNAAGAIRNYGRVEFKNLRHSSTNETAIASGQIVGVADLVLDGVSTQASPLQASASGLTIDACNSVTINGSDLRWNSAGAVVVVARYDDLTISDTTIGGATSGPNEFSALSLEPNANACINIDNVVLRDAARPIVLTGTHAIARVSRLQGQNIQFPALPASLASVDAPAGIDARAYGVNPDNPDNTAAFNAASAAAVAAGGGNLILPVGTLTGRFVRQSGVRISGAGRNGTTLRAPDSLRGAVAPTQDADAFLNMVVSAPVSSGATVIPVRELTAYRDGDRLMFYRRDYQWFRPTITSVDRTAKTVTVSAGIPIALNTGDQVYNLDYPGPEFCGLDNVYIEGNARRAGVRGLDNVVPLQTRSTAGALTLGGERLFADGKCYSTFRNNTRVRLASDSNNTGRTFRLIGVAVARDGSLVAVDETITGPDAGESKAVYFSARIWRVDSLSVVGGGTVGNVWAGIPVGSEGGQGLLTWAQAPEISNVLVQKTRGFLGVQEWATYPEGWNSQFATQKCIIHGLEGFLGDGGGWRFNGNFDGQVSELVANQCYNATLEVDWLGAGMKFIGGHLSAAYRNALEFTQQYESAYIIGDTVLITGMAMEGASKSNCHWLGNNGQMSGGSIFDPNNGPNAATENAVGIEIGDSVLGYATTKCTLEAETKNCSGGAVKWTLDGGENNIVIYGRDYFTQLSAGIAGGVAILPVTFVSGFAVGQTIGVDLTDGTNHVATITAIGISTITIGVAVPSAASLGALVRRGIAMSGLSDETLPLEAQSSYDIRVYGARDPDRHRETRRRNFRYSVNIGAGGVVSSDGTNWDPIGSLDIRAKPSGIATRLVAGSNDYCIIEGTNKTQSAFVFKLFSDGSALQLDSGATPALRWDSAGHTLPAVTNARNLGASGTVWSNIYSQNAVTVTSDERLKVKSETEVPGLALLKALGAPSFWRWKVGGYDQETVTVLKTVTESQERPVLDGDGNPVMRSIWIDTPENGRGSGYSIQTPLTKTVEVEVEREMEGVVETPRSGKRLHAGYMAQDVEAALSDDLRGTWSLWGLSDPDNKDSDQHIRPDQLVPVLVKAILEISDRLSVLEKGVKP